MIDRVRPGVLRLTPRELDVLQLAADGVPPKDAAGFLGITLTTLRAHKGNILTKLDCHTTTHAVAIAMRAGKLT
jgi:DNA-binding CsgD family transcriptional regulator